MDELTGQKPSVGTTERAIASDSSRRLDVVNRMTGSAASTSSLQEEFAAELATLRGRVDALGVTGTITTDILGQLDNGDNISRASASEGKNSIGSINRSSNIAVLF